MHPTHTLLVVDDALGNIALLCSILEPFYRVKVATNGEKALQIVMGEEPPDLGPKIRRLGRKLVDEEIPA